MNQTRSGWVQQKRNCHRIGSTFRTGWLGAVMRLSDGRTTLSLKKRGKHVSQNIFVWTHDSFSSSVRCGQALGLMGSPESLKFQGHFIRFDQCEQIWLGRLIEDAVKMDVFQAPIGYRLT